ncbi:hypothetical protein [Acinetobacter nosocomialis]|uniref:hypothetical protein n=1 Tax=Acinetobacter nosocomialis TaxID=106654 RepID=UPI0033BC64C7
MGLKLVLFIDGENTDYEYPFPLDPTVEIDDPESVYRRMYGFSKSADPYRETPPFEHEYKIMWSED